ncbi:MAG: inositol monophosphatase [Candidatus Omnitrophica bacterium]|nr:inositol monophosphatase [Candidatus Omnitrophota bacterium]
MPIKNNQEITQLFQPLLQEARELIQKKPLKIYESQQKDISINLDLMLHDLIKNFLSQHFSFDVLSEEDKDQCDFLKQTQPVWIIDPLDGSFNVSRQIPMSCLSLGLWYDDTPRWGLIYDFNRDELFIGSLPENEICARSGAWCNQQPIQPARTPVAEGVLSTGYPSWRDFSDDALKRSIQQVQSWKKIRMIGSAALSLAWVGCGRVDAYMEEDIRIWDVAAGLAIVQAAGGQFVMQKNQKTNFVTVKAANGTIPVNEI